MSLTADTRITASIVSYNSADATRKAIDTLCRSDIPCEHIVVVDYDRLLQAPNTMTDVIPADNRGFGAGHNIAIRSIQKRYGSITSTHYHLFLNPDVQIPRHAIRLLKPFADRRVSAVGGQLVNRHGHPDPYCAGAMPSVYSMIRSKFLTPRLPRRPAVVERLSGAALCIRLADVLRVGGFNERYFLYFEDTDLCQRLRDSGGRLIFDPHVRIIHEGGASFRSRHEQKSYYDKSQERYMRTYASPSEELVARTLRRLWRTVSL